MHYCSLCGTETSFFMECRGRKYLECKKCYSISMSEEFYLTKEDELRRYKSHNNDVNDLGYNNFLLPVINEIKANQKSNDLGLDFGCGPGPLIVKKLKEEAYNIKLYDPFFEKDETPLQQKYEYIICTEVAEHFKSPASEFTKLKSLLKSGGTLYCLTGLVQKNINFADWHYKNDPTHVFFYSRDTFEWIKNNIGFMSLEFKGNLIILKL